MTIFQENATVCMTREQFDEAVRRGDPAPMLYTPMGRQRPVEEQSDADAPPRA